MAISTRWRWTRRILYALLALVLLLAVALTAFLRGSLAQLDGTVHGSPVSAPVTVARDARGVPLIAGADRFDVAYATGYVQAQERYFQMDLLRRVAAGELSELFGAKALPLDRARRLHRFRARAEGALAALAPAERKLVERYAAGVNAGLKALSARPFEYALVGAAPRPWSPADTMLVIYAMYFDLQGNLENRELARGWLREHATPEQLAFLLPEATQWDAPLDAAAIAAPAVPVPATAPDWWGQPTAAGGMRANLAALDWRVVQTGGAGDPEYVHAVGSNNNALSGARSASGGAIVSDDMHLGLQLPNIWYRAALQYPDAAGKTRRIVGVMLPGAPPVVVVGSNGRVAWGFTNSYGDYLDLIEAPEDPQAHPGQVRLPSGWETPRTFVETLLVKGAPAETLSVRETAWGPLRTAGGRTYAVHWTAHALQAVNLNALNMENVDTLDAALAIAPTLGIPAQNAVIGDSAGRIGWTIAGPLPRRAQPGAQETFPLATAAPGWSGWLAPEEYPRVVDPAGGQLSTSNGRQLAGEAARLIGDGGFDLGARGRQLRERLATLPKKAGERDAYEAMLDDRALFLAPWRARAIAALDAQAVAGNPKRAQFLRLMQTTWTGRAEPASVAYRLTRGFMHALSDELFGGLNETLSTISDKTTIATATSRWPVVLARLLDEKPRAWLPARHADWRAVQLAAIDRVIADVTAGGRDMAAATWGERNTAQIAHPIAQAVPALKRWLAVPNDQLPGDNHMPRVAGRNFGQSERLTVTPGREEQGLFSMPGGQSGHPLSPFFLAGHADWVAGRAGPLLPGPAKYTLRFDR
jgi:penicillin amidase